MRGQELVLPGFIWVSWVVIIFDLFFGGLKTIKFNWDLSGASKSRSYIPWYVQASSNRVNWIGTLLVNTLRVLVCAMLPNLQLLRIGERAVTFLFAHICMHARTKIHAGLNTNWSCQISFGWVSLWLILIIYFFYFFVCCCYVSAFSFPKNA